MKQRLSFPFLFVFPFLCLLFVLDILISPRLISVERERESLYSTSPPRDAKHGRIEYTKKICAPFVCFFWYFCICSTIKKDRLDWRWVFRSYLTRWDSNWTCDRDSRRECDWENTFMSSVRWAKLLRIFNGSFPLAVRTSSFFPLWVDFLLLSVSRSSSSFFRFSVSRSSNPESASHFTRRHWWSHAVHLDRGGNQLISISGACSNLCTRSSRSYLIRNSPGWYLHSESNGVKWIFSIVSSSRLSFTCLSILIRIIFLLPFFSCMGWERKCLIEYDCYEFDIDDPWPVGDCYSALTTCSGSRILFIFGSYFEFSFIRFS